MTDINSILVPVDFGEATNPAVEVALTMAKAFQAKLTLLHVCMTVPVGYFYAEGLSWPSYEMETLAKDQLDSLVATVRQSSPGAEGVILGGEPWRKILEVANDRKTDLIIVGTHGRTGLDHLLIGSVAEKVARVSPVPVLIVSSEASRAAKAKRLED